MLQISGTLINTGQSLVFRVDRDSKQHVNISGGPLAYRYQFEEFFFHYGIQNQHGSEHRIHGYTFPGEVGSHHSDPPPPHHFIIESVNVKQAEATVSYFA